MLWRFACLLIPPQLLVSLEEPAVQILRQQWFSGDQFHLSYESHALVACDALNLEDLLIEKNNGMLDFGQLLKTICRSPAHAPSAPPSQSPSPYLFCPKALCYLSISPIWKYFCAATREFVLEKVFFETRTHIAKTRPLDRSLQFGLL